MKKFLCILLSLMLFTGLFSGCGSEKDGRPKKKAVKRPEIETENAQLAAPKEGDLIAVFDTSLGEVRAVLFPDKAPMAVKNFMGLCEDGYYNNTTFHRVVYGFVVQGGDASGTGHKGTTIWDSPFPAEYSSQLHHFSGALCAAMSPDDPLSTASQFYFVQSLPQKMDDALRQRMTEAGTDPAILDLYDEVGGLGYLDYTDTVFGQVYDGMNVVDEIARQDTDETDCPVEDILINSVTITTYTAE